MATDGSEAPDATHRTLKFSTDILPSGLDDDRRFRLWRDLYCAQHGEAELTRLPDRPFSVDIEFLQVGTICVTRLDATLENWSRTARHVSTDARDDFLIGFNRSIEGRPALGSQRGRDIALSPGSAILFTNAEPAETRSVTPTVLTGICLPRKRIMEVVANVEDLTGLVIDPSNQAGRYLKEYAEFLLDARPGHNPALARHIENSLLDLIALMLGARGDIAELANMRGLRAARAQKILFEISEGYTRPNFSPLMVARKLGLSTRYIHDLLQETGTSFSERVLALRLQKARDSLVDPKQNGRSVSEIAFACGFNEASHFSRRFRARFGATPTQFRGSMGAGC